MQATEEVIGNLTALRWNESLAMNPFLREVHNQTDNVSASTADFLDFFRFDEFKAQEQSVENIAGAAYNAMGDLHRLAQSVYSGARGEIQEKIDRFKKESVKGFEEALELLAPA